MLPDQRGQGAQIPGRELSGFTVVAPMAFSSPLDAKVTTVNPECVEMIIFLAHGDLDHSMQTA